MPTITLTFDNTQATRIAKSLCTPFHGYTGDGSAQSKIDFYKNWVIKQTKEFVKEQESRVSSEEAILTTKTDIETKLIIS
jgi:hypothetical protein